MFSYALNSAVSLPKSFVDLSIIFLWFTSVSSFSTVFIAIYELLLLDPFSPCFPAFDSFLDGARCSSNCFTGTRRPYFGQRDSAPPEGIVRTLWTSSQKDVYGLSRDHKLVLHVASVFFDDCRPAGQGTVMKAWVYGCTVAERTTRRREYLETPELYAIAIFQTYSTSIDITFSRNLCIATGWECTGRTFRLIEKMQRTYDSIMEVRVIGLPQDFYNTEPCAVHACTPAVNRCRGRRPCTGAACLMAVLNVVVLKGLKQDPQFDGRNDLLTRFWTAMMSSRFVTMRYFPLRTPAELSTWYVGSRKNVESDRQSSRLSSFIL